MQLFRDFEKDFKKQQEMTKTKEGKRIYGSKRRKVEKNKV